MRLTFVRLKSVLPDFAGRVFVCRRPCPRVSQRTRRPLTSSAESIRLKYYQRLENARKRPAAGVNYYASHERVDDHRRPCTPERHRYIAGLLGTNKILIEVGSSLIREERGHEEERMVIFCLLIGRMYAVRCACAGRTATDATAGARAPPIRHGALEAD
ncbi:hypothetical protein EVAR_16583_1 [Eumeta japonica]|uniref:Uncharacterized protein n=1 Tax=Eumeta variegata TaxID=151549 RepID=A0A4C1U372_EUMVA|nr:hypothetical protein EVAR_16583_1 [Eumeta japonica]